VPLLRVRDPHTPLIREEPLSPPGTQVLCSFRLGHPTHDPGPSPRRPAEEVVLR